MSKGFPVQYQPSLYAKKSEHRVTVSHALYGNVQRDEDIYLLTICCVLGEIDDTPDEVEDEKVVTSQIAYLRMQLEEKRRHIEAEKYRAQAEWEDQRRKLGQTAFWYVMGKAQGSQKVSEVTGLEVRNLVAIVCLFVSYLKTNSGINCQ